MQITFLGHAGFVASSENVSVIIDPWMSSAGAYDASWFQYPCNHHLGKLVRDVIQNESIVRYIYVSHEHRDHFDPEFLQSCDTRSVTFVIPKFDSPAHYENIASLSSAGVIELGDGQSVEIPGGHLRLYVEDGGLERDSALVVKLDGETFLNMNDCKVHDRVSEILSADGSVDVLTAQFSGASWHPTCYDYTEEEYRRISRRKARGKFEATARLIEQVSPRVYLPSAGPPVFLDPALIHLNFQPVNIFPRAPQLVKFLEKRLAGLPVLTPDVMPGDVFDVSTRDFISRDDSRTDEASFESYVRSYASRYQDFFGIQQDRQDVSASQVLTRLRDHLQEKLDAFTLRRRVRQELIFALTESPTRHLLVDFEEGTVTTVVGPVIGGVSRYSIVAPAWEVARVLDGALTWEDFSLTFRVLLRRSPDTYDMLIQAFLMLESTDFPYLAQCVEQLESQRERMVVKGEAGADAFDCDRFCPHSGADLSGGWRIGDRLFCPRHRMAFDLANGGQCMESGLTVNATRRLSPASFEQ